MKIRSIICWVAVLMIFHSSASGQITTIKGSVSNAETGAPLAGATVYLANTTLGGQAASDGSYIFKTRQKGTFNLVFSFVGFEKHVQGVRLDGSNLTISTSLKPKVYKMKQLEVSAKKNSNWEKYYERFLEEFLGTTDFAHLTSIKNPWDIDFKSKNSKRYLLASSHKPLIIHNYALGYRVYIELVNFDWNKDVHQVKYEMYPRFEPMNPADREQARQWQENRIHAYAGSLRHFLTKLHSGTINSSDFVIKWPRYLSQIKQSNTEFELFQQGVSAYQMEGYKGYRLRDGIDVAYNRKIKYTFDNQKYFIEVEKNSRIIPNTKEGTIYIRPSYILLNPQSIVSFGDWADARIANTLPLNYRPKIKSAE